MQTIRVGELRIRSHARGVFVPRVAVRLVAARDREVVEEVLPGVVLATCGSASVDTQPQL
jgi:hypothetical protein